MTDLRRTLLAIGLVLAGLVVVEFVGQKMQVEPEAARRMAMLLLESAEAAEADAALVNGLSGLGMPRNDIGKTLQMMRDARERGRSND